MQKLDIYSPALEHIGALYSWTSLVWTDCFNEGGSFQLELVPSARKRALLAPDHLLRYSETGTIMVITSLQIEDGEMLISGKDAAHILSGRVTTEVIPAGNAETALRAVVAACAAGWDILDPGEDAGLTGTFAQARRPDTVEGLLQSICQEADIGYRLVYVPEAGRLRFECYDPGENADAIFSPRYRNISDVVYAESCLKYRNVCVVLSGSVSDGYTVRATVGDTEKTGHERREMVLIVSSGDDDYEAQGRQALAEQADILSVDCSLAGGAGLGEIVTIRLPEFGVSVKKRITGIRITAEHGSTETTWTVGSIIR